MKNLFDDSSRQQIIERISKLTPDSKPLWGKMSGAQMLAHISVTMELALEDPKPQRSFIGRIIGGFIRKKLLSPEPFKKNGFTPKELKVDTPEDFDTQKERMLILINKFTKGGIKDLVHPFFGEMSEEEWGWLQYKHIDHHLRQFGV